MDLRTPLLVMSLLSYLGLGAWGLSLSGEVTRLEAQVDALEAEQLQAAERRADRQKSASGPGARKGGGASRPMASGRGARAARSGDSGRAGKQRMLEIAEDNVRAELRSERRARMQERAEEVQQALLDYAAEAALSEEVTAELVALFQANRADMSALFTQVDAGELSRDDAHEEMRAIRDESRAAIEELLGEEGAEALEAAVFEGRGPPR